MHPAAPQVDPGARQPAHSRALCAFLLCGCWFLDDVGTLPPCQVIKPYRKLLRDIGNLFISTMESRKPMATAKPSKPRPVRFVLFTDVLVLSEPKDGNLILSTEPCSQALLHKVDLAHATINT